MRLAKLEKQQSIRLRNATEYTEALTKLDLMDRVTPLGRTEGSDHCWHQYIIRVEARDRLREELAQRGIDTGVYYPGTLPQQSCFAYLGHSPGDFPVAQSAARSIVALPVHHRLQEGAPTRVVEVIHEVMEIVAG